MSTKYHAYHQKALLLVEILLVKEQLGKRFEIRDTDEQLSAWLQYPVPLAQHVFNFARVIEMLQNMGCIDLF